MKENSGFACFGLLIFALGSVVVASIMNGWVLSILWGWFIVPLFGLPLLSIPESIGFALVIGILSKNQTTSSSKDKDTSTLVAEIIGYGIFSPLFFLFMGWIIKLFL